MEKHKRSLSDLRRFKCKDLDLGPCATVRDYEILLYDPDRSTALFSIKIKIYKIWGHMIESGTKEIVKLDLGPGESSMVRY